MIFGHSHRSRTETTNFLYAMDKRTMLQVLLSRGHCCRQILCHPTCYFFIKKLSWFHFAVLFLQMVYRIVSEWGPWHLTLGSLYHTNLPLNHRIPSYSDWGIPPRFSVWPPLPPTGASPSQVVSSPCRLPPSELWSHPPCYNETLR